MRSFRVNSFEAAIIVSTLIMGMLGAFVLIPVACIQWTWNSVAAHLFSLPLINAWQAILLYIAAACLLYISGLVQIRFESDSREAIDSKSSEPIESKTSEPIESNTHKP